MDTNSPNNRQLVRERPSARFLRLAKTSLRIRKIKKFRRHFSSGEVNVNRKLQFDDTLSINDEHIHQQQQQQQHNNNKIYKLYPIMKKLANILHITKSTNNATTTTASIDIDDNVNDNNLSYEQQETETYFCFEDDLKADINKYCSEGNIEMKTLENDMEL